MFRLCRSLSFSFAKTNLDLSRFRSPEEVARVKESLTRRFRSPEIADQVVKQDQICRQMRYEYEQLRKSINNMSRTLNQRLKSGQQLTSEAIEQEKNNIRDHKQKQTKLADTLKNAEALLYDIVNSIGNIVHKDVPVSTDEAHNRVEYRGELIPGTPISRILGYEEVFNSINGLDLKRGQKIAGHRGYFLKGEGFKLARALTNYALDFLEHEGYQLHQPPVMIKQNLMEACCQLSTMVQDVYKVEGEDLVLIATSEQPLASMFSQQTLEQLPLKLGGYSSCFRKEAGAHGKDNQGIFRVHNFEKIEQFVICKEEESEEYLEKMIKSSMKFYDSLLIPYHVVSIVSGELNDAATRKYDLEAWFPHSQRYRELVSVSNCTDYQSRMLEIKYRGKGNTNKYVHMLNGTLCAVQRTLCCLVQNWQTNDGINIPPALAKYTGTDFIKYRK